MASATLFELSGIIDIKTNNVQTKLNAVDKQAKTTGKSLQKTGESASSAGNKSNGLGSALGKLSTKFISITAIIGAATKALMEYGKVSTEVAQLGTLFVGNVKASNELADATKKYADALGIDKVKALAGAYKVVSTQLGSTTEQYKDATLAALKLARVGRAVGDSIDVTGVVNLLSTEIRAFGMDASDADKISNQLFKTIQLGNTDINQLASSLPQVSAVAADVGVSFKELLAIIAGASKVIPDNVQITSSLTTSIAQLQNSTAGVGKKFTEVFGMKFKDALAQTGSLTNLMVEFDNRLKASGSSLAEAFGVRGLKGMQAIVAVSDDINASLQQIDQSSGLVNAGIKQLNDTGGLSFGQLKESVEELLATIGSSLAPILKALIPLFQALNSILVPIAKIVAEILNPIFEVLGSIFQQIGDVLADLFQAFSPIIGLFKQFWNIVKPLLDLALKPILMVFNALKPALSALKPILQVVGFILKGIGIVIKGIVWLAAKAIDLITKVLTFGFGGTHFADDVSKAFESGGSGDLNKADDLLSKGGASDNQLNQASEFGQSSASAAGLSGSLVSQAKSGGTTVVQNNNFTQPDASIEDLQRQQREASRKAMVRN